MVTEADKDTGQGTLLPWGEFNVRAAPVKIGVEGPQT